MGFKVIKKKLLFAYLANLTFLLAGGCFLLDTHEKDIANKVRNYFKSFKDVPYYFDMWNGKIGKNLYEIPIKIVSTPLKTLGHTIQCTEKFCYNTFKSDTPEKKIKIISFKDKNFKSKFEMLLAKSIVVEKQNTCSVEFLAFNKKTLHKNFLPILETLRNLECETRVIGKRDISLPKWPRLSKKSVALMRKIKRLKNPKREEYIRKLLTRKSNRCDYLNNFMANTKTLNKEELREKLFNSLNNKQMLDRLDSCKIRSENLIMLLRLFLFDTEKRTHLLYEKKIKLVPKGNKADITITPKHKNWEILISNIFKKKKQEVSLSF